MRTSLHRASIFGGAELATNPNRVQIVVNNLKFWNPWKWTRPLDGRLVSFNMRPLKLVAMDEGVRGIGLESDLIILSMVPHRSFHILLSHP